MCYKVGHTIWHPQKQKIRKRFAAAFVEGSQEVAEPMRILKLIAGLILLGGAAWATVRTHRARGRASWFILLFALFLVGLGFYFVVDAVAAWVREFRVGSEWIR